MWTKKCSKRQCFRIRFFRILIETFQKMYGESTQTALLLETLSLQSLVKVKTDISFSAA
jgi:hypothetical protein